MTKKNESSDLDVLFPNREIEIAGEMIKISPYKFKHLPKVMDMLEKISESTQGKITMQAMLIAALKKFSEESFEFIGWSLNKKKEWVEELNLKDATLILTTLWEVNRDFFVQEVLPLLEEVEEMQIFLQEEPTNTSD